MPSIGDRYDRREAEGDLWDRLVVVALSNGEILLRPLTSHEVIGADPAALDEAYVRVGGTTAPEPEVLATEGGTALAAWRS